ncbi:uncharacterized protein BDZ99DRAFT_482703 [Mytilinidion resinicola]|uniref:F-box domain-containing protein n=1 Tax=Mytilinidion resinicola TaxID=574789 RepID=A0A6A6Y2X4_9PEZI|nr:uncharacterized protein BDZ99DRAFT_482703 [Mytilinidion resinicola]KAF2802565.1 hypothetical protein BDZ99DRAFT_482703 [Mytilinidion resinicola]
MPSSRKGRSSKDMASAAPMPLPGPESVRQKRRRLPSEQPWFGFKRPRRSTEPEVEATSVMVDAGPTPEAKETSLEDLPAELLHMVCNYVDVKGLKALRRSNRRMSEIAVSHLFSEVCLTAMDLSHSKLDLLLRRPEMRKAVRSMQYDSYIIPVPSEDFDYRRYFTGVLILTLCQALHKSATSVPTAVTQDAHKLAFHLQKDIDNRHVSLINSVTMVQHTDRMPRLNSLKYTGGPPDLQQWDQSNRTAWLRDIQYGPAIGLFSTLLACHKSGIELKKLQIEWDGLAMLDAWHGLYASSLYRVPNFFQRVMVTFNKAALAHLTSFSWQMRIGELEERPAAQPHSGFLYRVLRGMPQLKELEISFRCKSQGPRMPSVRPRQVLLSDSFGSAEAGTSSTWANLEPLSLAGMHTEVEDLFAILENHRLTLKVLQLEGIAFQRHGDWAVALPRLREWVRLAYLQTLGFRGDLVEGMPSWDAAKDCRYKPEGDSWMKNVKAVEYLTGDGEFPLVNKKQIEA